VTGFCALALVLMGLVGLLLVGCAVPGGIHKGYEGSPEAVENIAVECDPFSVDSSIVNAEAGAVVAQSTRLGNATCRETGR